MPAVLVSLYAEDQDVFSDFPKNDFDAFMAGPKNDVEVPEMLFVLAVNATYMARLAGVNANP